ncbi:MAG: hypothetical protein ACP6IP_01640 [Candidatus Njordarchaeia archaeon]
MQKDTYSSLNVIKHYTQGRFGLCKAIEKIFGENGERLYLIEEKWETLKKPLLDMLKHLDADSILQCGTLILRYLIEIDFPSFIETMFTILKISGIKSSRELVKELYSQELIDIDELLDYIEKLENEKKWSNLIKALLIFKPIIPTEIYNKCLHKIAKKQKDKAEKWFFLASIDNIHTKKLLNEFEELYRDIKSLHSKGDLGNVFESLAKIYAIYLRADLDAKEYIETKVRELFQENNTYHLLRELKKAEIDKFYADTTLWFVSLFPQRFDVNDILPIIMDLVESGILVNMDHVSELFSRLTIRDKKLPIELLSLKSSRSWRKRLLAAYIMGGLLQHGDKKVLHYLAQLCRDKRSEVRKKCANSLLHFLEKSAKIESTVIKAILASSWTEGITKMIYMLLSKETPREVAEIVVANASKIPRSSIIEALVEFISKNYTKIESDLLLDTIIRILSYSSKKKILLSKAIDLTLNLLTDRDFKEKFLKELSHTAIPNETKRLILKKIGEIDL